MTPLTPTRPVHLRTLRAALPALAVLTAFLTLALAFDSDGASTKPRRTPPRMTASSTDSVVVYEVTRFTNESNNPNTWVLFDDSFTPDTVARWRYVVEMAKGSTGPTSATLSLDDRQYIGTSEFGSTSTRVLRTIDVSAGDNPIALAMKGAYGSSVDIRVVRVLDPTYTVFGRSEYVKDGATDSVETDTFRIPSDAAQVHTLRAYNGTAAGASRVTTGYAWLNNSQVLGPSDFGTGRATATKTVTLFSHDTLNTLKVSNYGATGTRATLWFTVTDSVPPRLSFEMPSAYFVTSDSSALGVHGTVHDTTACIVLANGGPVAMDTDSTFHWILQLPLGALAKHVQTYTITAVDAAGLQTDSVRTVVIDRVKPAITILTPPDSFVTGRDTTTIRGVVVDSTLAYLTVNGDTVAVDTSGAFSKLVQLAHGANSIVVQASDWAGNEQTITWTVVRYTPGVDVPPDPSLSAPPLDKTGIALFSEGIKFLFRGTSPVQTGVTEDSLADQRMAVIRGRTLLTDGRPLDGVKVQVAGHGEFGSSISRSDGMYDLVVNGGGPLTLRFTRDGYIEAQRQVVVPWRDFVFAPDAALLGFDPDSSATMFDPDTITVPLVARGSTKVDTAGTRRATLMFERGTTADKVVNGVSTTLEMLTVRATEYTVGTGGPLAMPAELPPMSGYTYCVELSVDEAMSAGATDVVFSAPVPFYVENFLGFPVGLAVPFGRYDRQTARWIPLDNGRVILITDTSGGIAQVAVSNDSLAADTSTLLALGIDAAERQRLAELYSPGQSLWRTQLTHFSPLDGNFPYRAPAGSGPPAEKSPADPSPNPCAEMVTGRSTIECENQILHESLPIVGTPYSLTYSSDRVVGHTHSRTIRLPISGASVSPYLKRIELRVSVAGRRETRTFPASPNQSAEFTWDGLDAFGRPVLGQRQALVDLTYYYPQLYSVPADEARAWGLACQGPGQYPGQLSCEIPGLPPRPNAEIAEGKRFSVDLFGSDQRFEGLGGWAIDVHHSYDFEREGELWMGDGSRRSGGRIHPVLNDFAGTGVAGNSGDEGPATDATLGEPHGVAIAPDGGVYITDGQFSTLRYVNRDGVMSTVVSTGLSAPFGIAIGPDTSVYIADSGSNRILRLSRSGLLSTIAGTGVGDFTGDGAAAVDATLNAPSGVALAKDGSLLIADTGNHCLRLVGADGIIWTIAGNGTSGSSGDEGAAAEALLESPRGVAVAPDGVIYVADTGNDRIRRIGRDGVITAYAGTGTSSDGIDGEPATETHLSAPVGVLVGQDGLVYVADTGNDRIRAVDGTGIMRVIAGASAGTPILLEPNRVRRAGLRPVAWRPRSSAEPALASSLGRPEGLAITPEGTLYLAERSGCQVRALKPVLPGFSSGEVAIVSTDASEIYVFTNRGRHVRTVDSRLGIPLLTFGYDSADSLLTTITDRSGQNTTTILREDGRPTGIQGPYTHLTTLHTNANGYLDRIENPAGEAIVPQHNAGGLLLSLTNPREHTSSYEYDDFGRLVRDEDAAGGYFAIDTSSTDSSRTVSMRTAEVSTPTTYEVVRRPNGDDVRRVTSPAGIATTTRMAKGDSIETFAADGTYSLVAYGADPRFGMSAPVPTLQRVTHPVATPELNIARSRVVDSDRQDPARPTGIRDVVVFNNEDTYTTQWDRDTRSLTASSPMGRVTRTHLDELGRVDSVEVSGLARVSYSYDTRGRLATSAQGGREWSYAYDDAGRLESVTDPKLRVTRFEYDLADRLVLQVLPDSREVGYSYDSTGNMSSLTPPGRPAHRFSYTPVDLTSRYGPPDVGLDSTGTGYTYDLDRALLTIARPDSVTVSMGYDPAGRLSSVSDPRGSRLFGFNPASGHLASLTSPDGVTLAYTYDGSLPLSESWSGVVSGSVSLTYDSRLRPASQQVNNSDNMEFGYDADGLLTQAGDEVLERSPDNGLLTGTTLDQVATTQGFNGSGELAAFEAKHGASSLFNTIYTRDPLGRITSIDETVLGTTRTLAYEYDLAGRLERVRENGSVAQEYTYDTNGNRLTYSGATSADTASATYDDQDRMLRYRDTRYLYGANGELRLKAEGADSTRYTYDALGNLVQVVLPAGAVIEYVIDGQNRRVGRKVDGTLVQGWLYQNGLNPIAELDGAGTVVARYIYGSRGHVPDYVVKDSTYRIVTDHLGSVRLVVNAQSGTVAQRRDYDAWGNVTLDTNPGFVSVGYAGGILDDSTGLVRFGARDYEARSGRWTRSDLVDVAPAIWTGYPYADNDPIGRLDPEGDLTQTEAAIIQTNCALGGAIIGSLLGFFGGGGGAILTGGGALAAPVTATLGARIGAAVGGGLGLGVGTAVVNALGGTTLMCQVGDGSGGSDDDADDQSEDFMGGNQRENEQARAAAREAGLDREQRRILHDTISGRGYGYRKVAEIAKAIKRGEIH